MLSPTYIPRWISDRQQDEIFYLLRTELDWIRHPDAPRSEYWMGPKPYTYGRGLGRRTYQPQPTHVCIEDVITWLFRAEVGFIYNACFLNMYENEQDSLGWHADDDPGIDHSRPIAVVTLGNGRDIQFKAQDGSEPITTQFLEPGSLLLMPAGFQQTHFHRIPKAGRQVGPRISMTYRSLL